MILKKIKEDKHMSKNANPMKVITGPDTRWSYANVWEAKSINGGTPKFSVSLIIPKSDTRTLNKIKAAIEAAYKEGEGKLKGNGKTVPDRKSTRLNSSHVAISYAVFCLNKEKTNCFHKIRMT